MQLFFASILPETGFTVSSGHALVDMFIVLGIIILLSVALFVIVSIVKGRKSGGVKRHDHKRAKSGESTIRIAESKAVDGESGRRRRKFRKRKKDHRPRNPTLAETGGLPPEAGQAAARGSGDSDPSI